VHPEQSPGTYVGPSEAAAELDAARVNLLSGQRADLKAEALTFPDFTYRHTFEMAGGA
jgi:hypothetical protein